MSITSCAREADVLDAVMSGRWETTGGDELHIHASSCVVCGELSLVASELGADYHDAARLAPIPTSGLMWWRMQRRAREEAVRETTRAIGLMQAAAIFAAITVALTVVGGFAAFNHTFRAWFARMADAVYFGNAVSVSWTLPMIAGTLAIVALTPVALYFAVAKD
jgi:hypothetical protein